MRPTICRCPNYTNCLLGYRGEDIEVTPEMELVCPECGTPLIETKRPRTSVVPSLVNWLAIVAVLVGIYFLWPVVVRTWNKLTTPPTEEKPSEAKP